MKHSVEYLAAILLLLLLLLHYLSSVIALKDIQEAAANVLT